MKSVKLASELEVYEAEVDRSIALVTQIWESPEELSVNAMCEQLEAINTVVEGKCNFAEFVKSTNLTGRERLN